jgi:hypothetical protein
MKECKDYREMIQSYIAGEISPAGLDSLYHHCQSCPDCGQLWEVHSNLAAAGEELPQPPEDGLLAMRTNVLAQITRDERGREERAQGTQTWARRIRWWDLGALLRAHPAAALPVAAALVVVSIVAGRLSVSGPETGDSVIMREISQQASRQAGLIDYWDTPLSYSNVDARPVEGGNLDLSFDVSRHVRLVTPMDSPVAREVLMYAILEPSAVGSKMKAMAMAMAPEIMDPKIKEALIFTMHNDPNLAVRMEAMSVLSKSPYDSDIQKAFLTTLRGDEEVQMRLQALEYLAEKKVNMNTLRRAIELPQLESDTAVLQYAAELIGDRQ